MERQPGRSESILTADDLLAGSRIVHEVPVSPVLLRPGADPSTPGGGTDLPHVRLRPLSVGTLMVISRAAREDGSLVPILMIKESLVEPAVSLEAIRLMPIGLVHYLVSQINRISGLTADGAVLQDATGAPSAQMHLLLARHFGWTPEQVSHLTPGQVAVYLAGVERLLALEEERR